MVLEKGKIKLNLCTAAAQRTSTQSEACLFFYNSAGDGIYISSEVTSKPSDTLGREFDPGKRDFPH